MSELTVDDFPIFFAALRGGQKPYPWQMDLARSVLTTGGWPDLVSVFTGGGKSVIPVIHVFARALLPDYAPRMVHVVPTRALVDSQHRDMRQVAAQLRAATDTDDGDILGVVARILRSRRADAAGDPLITEYRRGVMEDSRSRDWVVDPLACTTLTMTRDMAMSALLFQGYGTTRFARPVEAGLLGHGTVMVFDEAHTARQALYTARRVRDMIVETGAELPQSALQVVESTATPAPAHGDDTRTWATWSAEDESELGSMMHAHKPLTLHHDEVTAADVAQLALDLHRQVGRASGSPVNGTIAVVRNTVRAALDVATSIRKEDQSVRVLCLTGRMRAFDRRTIPAEVFTPAGSPAVDIIVATQVVEVGLDADWAAMITDIAPASNLVQRSGRVNRRGIYTSAPIHVLTKQDVKTDPYRVADIAAAKDWIDTLEVDDDGHRSLAVSSIWNDTRPPVPTPELIRSEFGVKVSWTKSAHEYTSMFPDPTSGPGTSGPGTSVPAPWKRSKGDFVTTIVQPCRVLHRVEYSDTWAWSESTSRARFRDDDLRLWLSDDLSDDIEAGIAVRWEPRGILDTDRADLLRALPVEKLETWNVGIGHVRRIVANLLDKNLREYSTITVIAPDGNVREVDRSVGRGAADAITPGSTVVLWSHLKRVGLTRDLTLDGIEFTSARLPRGKKAETDIVPERELRRAPHLFTAETKALRDLPLPENEWNDTAARKAFLAALATEEDLDSEVRSLLPRISPKDVRLSTEVDGKRRWAVIYTRANSVADEESTQASTPSTTPVTLENHSEDVAAECRRLALAAGLAPNLADALELAGRHHDLGKRDHRFQTGMLGNPDPATPWAKSLKSDYEVKFRGRSAQHLPYRWRHEQLSAALAHGIEHDHPERDLIALLCGLTHGWGRSAFPHGFENLTGGMHSDAVDLFTEGTWERMLHAANTRFGAWGLAWLEALVRAADSNISRQGR